MALSYGQTDITLNREVIFMTTTVHAENLQEHFGKTDDPYCHTGETSV